MEIKILGPGCAKCMKLYENAVEAAGEAGIDASVEKVTDMAAIAAWGVMSTPALVIDEKVVAMGRVPSKDQIKMLMKMGRKG